MSARTPRELPRLAAANGRQSSSVKHRSLLTLRPAQGRMTAAVLSWTLVAGVVSPVAAEPSPARSLFDQGVAHAEAKDYEAARRAFAASYQQEAGAESLFAWAQAERLAGHCDVAVDLYRRFLEGASGDRERQAASIGLRRCAELVPPTPPAAPSSEASANPTDKLGVARADPERPGAVRPVAAVALLSVGALAVVAGATFIALSVGQDNAAGRARNYDDYRDHLERGRLERGAGLALVGAGALTAATGALLSARWARRSPSVAWLNVPGTGAVWAAAWTGRF